MKILVFFFFEIFVLEERAVVCKIGFIGNNRMKILVLF